MHLAIFDFALVRAGHFEIEHAHTKPLLTLIRPAIARAHHYPRPGVLFAPHINHRMRDGRIALNRVRADPEEQVAWFQSIEFVGILVLTHDRLESAGASQ